MRYVRSHTPFVNLWYAKSVIDHAGLNDVQEMLSPGYQSRMRERLRNDWGTDFFWRPDEALPVRTPANSFTTTCSVLIILSSASSKMSSSAII